MPMFRWIALSQLLLLLGLGLPGLGPLQQAFAWCPFCAATGLSLRQKIEFVDVVAVSQLLKKVESESGGTGQFLVTDLIKSEGSILVGSQLEIPYVGLDDLDQQFLILGVEPPEFIWDLPVRLSEPGEQYLRRVNDLPADAAVRLQFFEQHLENSDLFIADDAFNEFAIAPFTDIQTIESSLQRDKIIGWLTDPKMSVSRKQLYYMLLSICGQPDDSAWLENRLRSDNPEDRQALDSLVACYLMLSGHAGLNVMDSLFISDPKRSFAELFSVVAAFRFHVMETRKFQPLEIADLFTKLLDRHDIADLIIPELARLEDWRQVERLQQLFQQSYESNHAAIRTPIINFMRVCPLAEAEAFLKQVEQTDPSAIRRAKTLMPFLVAPQGKPE